MGVGFIRWQVIHIQIFQQLQTVDKLRVLYVHRYPVNMLDSIQRCFSYGHYGQPESNMPDLYFLHLIRFHTSKESLDLIVQNQHRSYLDDLVKFWPNASVWKQAGVHESPGLVLA